MKSRKIIVSGAGLVGSLLAVALKRKGHDVLLMEKRPDMRKEIQGAGRSINLIVTAKGIRPLMNLGLWEKVKTITSPVNGRTMHSVSGELAYQPYGKDPTECNHSVSRGELNCLLLDEAEKAGVEIRFYSVTRSVDLEQKILRLESGEYLSYELLFGTDGAGSAVRTAMMSALGESAQYETEALGTDYKEMTMPSRNGNYAMDEHSLHIWPRGNHMLMGLPNRDGSFTMTLYLPKDWFDKFSDPRAFEDYFKTNYPDAVPLIPDYVEQFKAHPQGFLGVVRVTPWVFGNSVALLGDSAHAMVPFFGQGMNSGFSDVHYLLEMMEKYPEDDARMLQEYEAHQKPSGQAIQELSRENFDEMCDKVGDPGFLLRKKVEHTLENAFPEEFRSRYGLVTYTLIPYHLVKEVGAIQDEVLDELTRGLSRIEDLDLGRARKLIQEKISPWFRSRKLTPERFRF